MSGPQGALGAVDRGDVQADVLDALGHRFAHHLVITIVDAGAARRLLAEALPLVLRWPVHGEHKPELAITVGISGNGLARLGVDPTFVNGLGSAFVGGMASRADVLGDRNASDPSTWVPGFLEFDANLLIWIQGRHQRHVAAEAERWLARLDGRRLALVHQVAAAMHGDHREHFGFADGFSQPRIAGAHEAAGEEGALTKGGAEVPIPAGEFVFGHPDAMGVIAPIGYHPLARNGTILVWRQLHQDVAGFRAWVAQTAAAKRLDPVVVMAKIVGRWPDGTSLSVAPDEPPQASGLDRNAPADIRYGDDPLGLRCPVGAHVRRANPRDGMPQRTLANRHRLVRRGLPYGPPLAPDEPDDGAERGLVFTAFNADLRRQFEFVQSLWFNDGGELNLGTACDPIVGAAGGGHFVVPGHPPHVLDDLPPFVTTRAGEYFFVPGIAALRALTLG